MATDPVCGMYVDTRGRPLTAVQDNRTYYFCSHTCLTEFTAPAAGLARLRRRLAVAWPVAGAVVALTYLWHPVAWPWAALVLAGVAQTYCAGPFYRGAVDGLRSGAGNMDLLIAAGTSAAFLYSAVVVVFPGHLPARYYFDASTLIIAFILSGNYLEHLTRHRAGGALRRLREQLPSTARVVRAGAELVLPVAELQVGDRVRIRPGERIPADGTVRIGESVADESLVTGESLPVSKGPGSPVLQGTVNGPGSLEVDVTRRGPDATLERIASLLQDAELSRVPLQRTADRIGGWFVPVVLLLAIGASTVWGAATHFSDPTLEVLVFVAVVITACPCAFGLAAPAALLVGTGRAADEGIWFKDRDALEQGARVDLVLTDKTGTLTKGHPEVVEVWSPDANATEEAVGLAASVEQGSEHPLAAAVVRYAASRGLRLSTAERIRANPGHGVEGYAGGRRISVEGLGRAPDLDPTWTATADRLRSEGRTASLIRLDGRPAALLSFADPVLPRAAAGVGALQAQGIPVVMVTGDLPESAGRVARAVGISEVHALATPEAKRKILGGYRAQGRVVAFVGDGLNDAPVLAGADLGIAVGNATDVAREAGGIVLAGSGISGVAVALGICRATVRRVRLNFAWAIGYNAVLLPIAAGALVPFLGPGIYNLLPVLGAAAMGLSSTAVLVNSLALRWAPLGTGPAPGVPRSPLPS